MTAMVKAESVCKNFGALHVLKGVTLGSIAARCCAWSALRLGQVDIPALHQPS